MNLSILEALKPFSHSPARSWILPLSCYKMEIYPCLIRVFDWKQSPFPLLIELKFFFEGPLEEFTVSSDLEKGHLSVWGRSQEGFIRYTLIAAEGEGFYLRLEKAPGERLWVQAGEERKQLPLKQSMLFLAASSQGPQKPPVTMEKLSFGSHKAQEIESIRKRGDLQEILPLIHRLGQLLPDLPLPDHFKGSFELLKRCDSCCLPEEREERWKLFFLASFDPLLVPHLEDSLHQGIHTSPWLDEKKPSPLALLPWASRLIRNMFVREEEGVFLLLPALLPSLHFGRMTDVLCQNGIWLNIEWTKKKLRRVVLRAERDGECLFSFRGSIKSYRLAFLDKKQEMRRVSSSLPLRLRANQSCLLDCFE